MAKLTDDPRVAEAIAKAETRGATAERKRINGIIADEKRAAGDLEDRGQAKAAKTALGNVATAIKA